MIHVPYKTSYSLLVLIMRLEIINNNIQQIHAIQSDIIDITITAYGGVMLSISFKKLIRQRKTQIIIAVVVLFVILAGSLTFLIIRNNQPVKKAVVTVKTTTKTVAKPTATTDDVQSDLNAINSKSSSLDTEVDGANNGLSDQPANLTY